MKYQYYHNAAFHSLNYQNAIFHSLLILNGRIITVDDTADQMAGHLKHDVQKIDLQGHTVIPAFTDCHTHFAAYALTFERINLSEANSLQEALETIRSFKGKAQSGQWILGTGWNRNLWEDGQPNRRQLDEIFPDQPVALHNKDNHTLWVNTVALKQAGLFRKPKASVSAKIQPDTDGMPSGLIFEDMMKKVLNLVPYATQEQSERCLKKAARQLFSYGVTSVHSMEGVREFNFFAGLNRRGELPLRICMQPPAGQMEFFIKSGLISGYGDDWLRLGGMKYFVDGSLGSQTAEMFEKYDNLDHAGIGVLTEKELTEAVVHGAENGLSATIHAIGDKANFKTLNAIEKARDREDGRYDLRHRIEHAQILRKEDVPRYAKARVIASMQPQQIAVDVRIGNRYLGGRSRYAYPINSFLNDGTRVVFGSDAPIVEPVPLEGIYAAMTRKYMLDPREKSWYPEELISARQAVLGYTREAASASYEEHLKGTLEVGKLADFIVLDRDIFNIPAEEMLALNIEKTVLNGDIVYDKQN